MGQATIDLNSDLGENYGTFQLQSAAGVMEYISSVNIACGYHAGDPGEMNTTLLLAAENQLNCGAHPGYPDLLGFGRRSLSVTAEELRCYLIYQIGALRAIANANHVKLTHVKPHGSLYLEATVDESTAQVLAETIASVDRELVYYTLGGSGGQLMADYGRKAGLRVVREAFPARAYTPRGTLVDRKESGAVITDEDEIVQRVKMIVQEKCIHAIDGSIVQIEAESLSVPGDTRGAAGLAQRINQELNTLQVKVCPVK